MWNHFGHFGSFSTCQDFQTTRTVNGHRVVEVIDDDDIRISAAQHTVASTAQALAETPEPVSGESDRNLKHGVHKDEENLEKEKQKLLWGR